MRPTSEGIWKADLSGPVVTELQTSQVGVCGGEKKMVPKGLQARAELCWPLSPAPLGARTWTCAGPYYEGSHPLLLSPTPPSQPSSYQQTVPPRGFVCVYPSLQGALIRRPTFTLCCFPGVVWKSILLTEGWTPAWASGEGSPEGRPGCSFRGLPHPQGLAGPLAWRSWCSLWKPGLAAGGPPRKPCLCD